MREFMTKVSDYFNEWREDPEREDGQLTRVFIIAAAIVAAVLIALLLWWGYGVQEKRREEAAAKARELQETQKMQDAQAAFALQEAQGLVTSTSEEKVQEYMSRDSGEELRQEYLTNTNSLSEKVKELQEALEQVQKEVAEIVREYREGDSAISEKVIEKLTVLEKETRTVTESVKTLENSLTNLSHTVQTIDTEKIPAIHGQIGDLRVELGQVRSDVSDVCDKIKELRKEDEKLWNELPKWKSSLRQP